MFHSGLYSGDYLRDWLGGKLTECGVKTWADLAISIHDDPGMDLPPERQYRAVTHVSDITRGLLARLPWDYENYYGIKGSDQDVVDAVRASMSIPFFFVPVRTQTSEARTRLADDKVIPWPGGTVTWVDGGLLMNFAIGAFDRTDNKPPRWPTIGIKLSAEPAKQVDDVPVDTTVEEGYRCLKTLMGQWDRYHVAQEEADRIIFVRNDGITATQFDLSPEEQAHLFRNGAEAATDFLINHAAKGHVPRGS